MTPLAGATTRVSRASLPLARSRAAAAASRARAVATACCEVLRSRSAIAPALNSDWFCSSVHSAFASSAFAATRSASALARLLSCCARLEPREQLTGSHLLAFAHVDLHEIALDPRADVDRLERMQVAGEGDAVLDRHRRHGGDVGRRERDRRRRTPTGATTTASRSTRRASGATARRSTLLCRTAAAGALAAGRRAGRILRAGGRQREQRESERDGAERGRIRSHSTISEPTASSTSAGAGSAGRARARDRPKQGRGRTWRAPRSSARSAARAAHRRPRAAW